VSENGLIFHNYVTSCERSHTGLMKFRFGGFPFLHSCRVYTLFPNKTRNDITIPISAADHDYLPVRYKECPDIPCTKDL